MHPTVGARPPSKAAADVEDFLARDQEGIHRDVELPERPARVGEAGQPSGMLPRPFIDPIVDVRVLGAGSGGVEVSGPPFEGQLPPRIELLVVPIGRGISAEYSSRQTTLFSSKCGFRMDISMKL
jgi:hypothetical protein